MIRSARKKPRNIVQFRRYECKYLIPDSLAREIARYISPFVTVDPHASESHDNAYNIYSLYLDTPDLRLFWESQNGLLNRIKLRIRFYEMADVCPAFMEIKRRHDRLVLKDRARLDREAVMWMLAGGSPDTRHLAAEERACYEEFTGWIARLLARPTTWIRYRREAYVGTLNRDVRITMDRDLTCSPVEGRSGDRHPHFWHTVEDRNVVLEMKFDESCPDWMVQVVRHFGLEKRSYSKYGKSIRTGLDPSSLSPENAWSLPRYSRVKTYERIY